MREAASPSAQQLSAAFVSVIPGPLAAPVLRRVIGMLAARAQLPVDRLDEAILLVDALADHAGELTVDGRVGLTIESADRTLQIDVGPLRSGCGAQLVQAGALPGLGNLVERLSDELTIEPAENGAGELLRLRLTARSE